MFRPQDSYICKLLVCCSVTQLCPTLCHPKDYGTPGFPVLHHLLSLLRLISIESLMPSNHLILYNPLLLLPFIFHSIRVFSNELVLRIRWSKCGSFSFSISPSSEYSGLISFRMDSFDLLVIQGTLDWEGKELVKKGLEFASTWASGCFLGGSVVKNLPANAGDTDLIPGLGRSPGKGNGNLLQCCCLGNPTEIPQSLVGYSPWRYKESDTT